MKQSSIEWLYDQMSNIAAGYTTEHNQQEILEKAKAMHKQEIKDAFNMNTQCGIAIKPLAGVIKTFEAIDDEDYYNETFKECKD